MTYEERQNLKQQISDIQAPKEKRVRRMWIMTTFGEKLYMGGSSLPKDKQLDGYSVNHLPHD